jgi:tRNA nucleotidyltransferase/poly(A) polymerase
MPIFISLFKYHQPTMPSHLKSPIFKVISRIAEEMNVSAFVIGGFVRDCMMGREVRKDIDIVVTGSGIDFAREVANALGRDIPVKYFKNFGTAMLKSGDTQVEFVGARKESYHRDSRKPVVENGTFEEDQHRRDFTINAMAFDLGKKNFGNLVDPFNGMSDIREKIIRTPLDPDITFSDDPLRMMRAIRFACQLGFTIEGNCFEAIKRNAERITIVSAERISDELNLIIQTDIPSVGLRMLDETGLLQIIFPDLVALKGTESIDGKGHKDNFYHTLEVLDNVSANTQNLWLRWAAILHDIGKPGTKKFVPGTGWTFHAHDFKGSKMVSAVFRKLRLPLNEKMKYV